MIGCHADLTGRCPLVADQQTIRSFTVRDEAHGHDATNKVQRIGIGKSCIRTQQNGSTILVECPRRIKGTDHGRRTVGFGQDDIARRARRVVVDSEDGAADGERVAVIESNTADLESAADGRGGARAIDNAEDLPATDGWDGIERDDQRGAAELGRAATA